MGHLLPGPDLIPADLGNFQVVVKAHYLARKDAQAGLLAFLGLFSRQQSARAEAPPGHAHAIPAYNRQRHLRQAAQCRWLPRVAGGWRLLQLYTQRTAALSPRCPRSQLVLSMVFALRSSLLSGSRFRANCRRGGRIRQLGKCKGSSPRTYSCICQRLGLLSTGGYSMVLMLCHLPGI